MGKPSRLRVWVKDYGGAEKVAIDLGVTSYAVRWWLNRRGYPKVETLLKIRELSKNKLSLEDIIYSAAPLKARG